LPPRPLPLSQLVETPWCVEYRLSSQGLRDRPYGPVPPGVLRIAGVGDSFVAGEGVPLGLSLCKQLEQLLGSGYEVVNAGRPGLGTQGELARWRSLAPLGCRRAIVVFIANDVDVTAPLQQRQAYINDLINIRQENLDRIYGRPSGGSRLLEYARQKLLLRDITRDTVQWYLDCYSDENRNNVARLEQAIRDFAANPDCPVVFVLYPLLENLERGYPLQRIHDLVGGMLQGAGIAYLDLAATFQGQDTRSLWVHDVDHHPNGKAHRLAAEAIARWLKREQPWFLESPR
jgi:lysophospholipase L1-like esterase